MTNSASPEWYVAYVRSCGERKAKSMLDSMGVECFLPIHKVLRHWSDRVKLVDTLVLPRMIFIHTEPSRRIPLLDEVSQLTGYMSSGGTYHPVVVPDAQMDAFIRMVTGSDDPVEVCTEPLAPGDKVRIVAGPLKGLECELVTVRDRKCVAVRLGGLGAAYVEFDVSKVTKID